MTWTAVGSIIQTTTTSLALSPVSAGHLTLVEVVSQGAVPLSISGGNCTWVQVGNTYTGFLNNGFYAAIFAGTATTSGSATATLTFTATPTVIRCVAQEFSSSVGMWYLDGNQGNLDTIGITSMSSLIPSGSGDLYFGYEYDSGSASAGSTSGYVYQVDAHGNGLCYDVSCGSGTQSPTWSSATCSFGISVLIKETSVGSRTTNLATAQMVATTGKLAPVGLVQETSGSTTGTSLTLNFTINTTPGNAVIIAIAGYYNGTISAITIGGTGGTFTHLVSAGGTGGNNAGIYANLSVAQSSTTLVITSSAAGILAWAYEVAGTVVLDVVKGAIGTGTSWSSGASAATIAYPHFVVGLGSVIANTGTITATASGWTNETSYHNVVGAGSHAIGAVSGYQQPSSSGTYTYSGTSAVSSAWGAVNASFLVVPTYAQIQTNWGGYAFAEHASYTGITATFTVPTLSAANFDSVWVGMGNVYQIGIFQTYDVTQTGNSANRPWSWWLPGAGEAWNAANFPIAAGNTLTLTMQLTDSNWLMTMTNVTTGQTYTEVKSALAVNIGSIDNDGAGPAVWRYPIGTVEVIIERELVPLPNYGSLTFSSIVTTPPISQAPYPIFTVNANIDQYPSTFNPTTGSFTMHWNAAS